MFESVQTSRFVIKYSAKVIEKFLFLIFTIFSINHNHWLSQYFVSREYAKFPEVECERTKQDKPRQRYETVKVEIQEIIFQT